MCFPLVDDTGELGKITLTVAGYGASTATFTGFQSKRYISDAGIKPCLKAHINCMDLLLQLVDFDAADDEDI